MPGTVRSWRSSLRVRLTVAGVGLAIAIFAIGGFVTITLYQRSLTSSVEHSATQTATTIASRIKDQWLPVPIPMPTGPDVPRVQVLDRHGKVITGDPSSAGQPAMYQLAAGLSKQQVTVSRLSLLPGASAFVYAVRVSSPAGPETVVAALSLGGVAAKTGTAADSAAAICAGALVVVGIVAWLTVGRVLRPVERMRTRAVAITASRDLSGRLPQSGSNELSKLAETLNGMLTSLEQSVDRQRRFVADAAHELRTPLSGLTATLEIARQHPDMARDTLLGELLAGHRRLSRTLNDLLVLAALDGHAAGPMSSVDLAGVVTDCSRRRVPEGVHLQVSELERAVVLGNESQLSRIVANLLDNALRYTRTTVELALTVSGGRARISVTDDGPGIPEADTERVWDRFVRLDDDRSQESGGSGLGLAIVRELTRAHGGTATVRGRACGRGAEFLIELPLRREDQASRDQVRATAMTAPQRVPAAGTGG